MFYELPPGSKIPSKKKMPVGSICILNDKIYRRCKNGVMRSAERGGMDPTIYGAFWKRSKKRMARGLSPRPYGGTL